ncbi:MAG: DUF2782 domain-containing protein [Rhodocyclaceae bacterium]|jgi:hypothetical protein|nr:DUF2782 domain-containing protein [Rhodocyclaceae bacterium]
MTQTAVLPRTKLMVLVVALSALSLVASAQNRPPDLIPLPEIPAPPPGVLAEDELQPEVRIVKRGDDTVEEHRINGKLYMVKVIPSHGVPYYLFDEKGDGVLAPRAPDGIQLSVPMWVIGTF